MTLRGVGILICHYNNSLCVNPTGFYSPNILYLLSSFSNPPTDFSSCQQAELQKLNKAYLWPRSKVWMQAYKRTFKPPRLKSQICFIYLQEFVCSASSQIRIFAKIIPISKAAIPPNTSAITCCFINNVDANIPSDIRIVATR